MENSESKEKTVLVPEESTVSQIKKTLDNVKKIAVSVDKVVSEIETLPGIDAIKKRIKGIRLGRSVTILCGDLSNQSVRRGQIVSMIENGITIIDIMANSEEMPTPVLIQYKDILDIFETDKVKRQKEPFSMFKLNKKIYEFFNGNEEEIRHAYEQKISVKQLRDKLKKDK
jgi:hypothetical protein